MSWSVAFDSKEMLAINQTVNGLTSVASEGNDQYVAAKAAALALIASGSVGGADKDFMISLSGHSNPGHEKASGCANDAISVSLYQKG